MKKMLYLTFTLLFLFSLFSAGETIALSKPLETKDAKADEVTGTYTLILYGGRHGNDIETVAILDKEGDKYTFEPNAPVFDYRIITGLSGKEALDKAQKFVSFHGSFWHARLSKILDSEGNTIGYELRPRYFPTTFGTTNVLDVDYFIRDNKVVVYIKLKPEIERMLFGGDGKDKN